MDIKLYINNDKLSCPNFFTVYTGNVGTYRCVFDIKSALTDASWFCVFKQGGKVYSTVIEGNACVIPHEVLESNEPLYIGCYGVSSDETEHKRVSTNWIIANIEDGAYSEAAAPETPSPDVWEELVSKTVPIIGNNGNWFIYDMTRGEYVDSGVSASGSGGGDTQLTDEQIANINKIPDIEEDIAGLDVDTKTALSTAGNAYGLAEGADVTASEALTKAGNAEFTAELLQSDLQGVQTQINVINNEVGGINNQMLNKQDKLSDEQLANIEKIPTIEENVKNAVGDIQNTFNTLDFNFIPGYINPTTGIIQANNYSRLVTKEIMCLPYDIVVKKNSLNRVAVFTYSDYEGNNPVDNGWISSEYTITGGTFFRISFANLAGKETQILVPVEESDLYQTIEIYRVGFEGINLRDTSATQRRLDVFDFFENTIRPIPMPKKVIGINHRGFNTVAPENTLEAFKLSKMNGFDYVECDVAFTSDNIPVLLHDNNINRTARNSDGTIISETINIADITYNEALQYDFGIWKSADYTGTKIPTFEEFLHLCRRLSLHPYIELKTTTLTDEQVKSLLKIVKKHNMLDNVTWISSVYANLARVIKFYKKARIGLLYGAPGHTNNQESYLKYAKRLQTEYNEVFIDANMNNVDYPLTDEIINLFIEYNIPIEVYCPNTEEEILALNPYISGVTSDKLVASIVLAGDDK